MAERDLASGLKFNSRKEDHMALVAPVAKAMRDRRLTLGWSMEDLSTRVGIPKYQVSRILNAEPSSPNWVDVTRILVGLGITPNEGAELAGLYHEQDENGQDSPQHATAMVPVADASTAHLVKLYDDAALSQTSRKHLLEVFEAIVKAERRRADE
jgi:transcriptional regulator with XRE-family HTH domain